MKISACIPVYEVAPDTLARTLASLEAQQRPADEIVVCDDHSSIDYQALMRPLVREGRVRFERNERNLGMVGNWNTTVERSVGDLVIVVGQDDELDPAMFSQMAQVFETRPDVVLVSCGVQFIGPDSRAIDFPVNVNHRRHIFIDQLRYDLSGRDVAYLCLRNGCAIGELSAMMFRRSAWSAAGGFDPVFKHGADVDFAISVSQLGKTAYLTANLLRRRMHDGNLTWKNLASGAIGRDRAQRFEKHQRRHEFCEREISMFRTYLVACACWDILRIGRHRSPGVIWNAVRQVSAYSHFDTGAYWTALGEIVSGRNIDRR